MWVWAIILGVGLSIELAALLTKERYFPTLSRTTWKLFKLEDRGYDRAEKIVRWILTILLTLLFTWVIIHIAWGPCAFGWC